MWVVSFTLPLFCTLRNYLEHAEGKVNVPLSEFQPCFSCTIVTTDSAVWPVDTEFDRTLTDTRECPAALIFSDTLEYWKGLENFDSWWTLRDERYARVSGSLLKVPTLIKADESFELHTIPSLICACVWTLYCGFSSACTCDIYPNNTAVLAPLCIFPK